ncbi:MULTISPECIES: hypothetical protein [unclassified Mesorhizobium]|uniref:hypothetical protein n=1 Tax=unclassified Mesorhizobium TaxID=325217 RepID=UPI000FCA38FB|nr:MULTISPECIES: hypothetical protein [unclassified Mesorhizobium]RUX98043.1 hypothetical protein EN993_00955 [Mesorhizobium sp. M7D.F.Ca.US.004.01.2.1]RVA31907.1 hypothetical protein EN935_12805 [Mesorhizobium sp. M7D.F.Ca.US.004.03.1.1]
MATSIHVYDLNVAVGRGVAGLTPIPFPEIPMNDTFITGKVMEIVDRLSALSALSTKMDGFIETQTSVHSDIEKVRADVATMKSDIMTLKNEKAKQRAYLAGGYDDGLQSLLMPALYQRWTNSRKRRWNGCCLHRLYLFRSKKPGRRFLTTSWTLRSRQVGRCTAFSSERKFHNWAGARWR